MALREACSPSNMVAASEPGEVLTKIDVLGVVRRKVDAKPDPPCDATWVVDESRERASRMEGSIEGGMETSVYCELKQGRLIAAQQQELVCSNRTSRGLRQK